MRVSEPRVLETLTIRAASDLRSRGTKAWVTARTPKTWVSHGLRIGTFDISGMCGASFNNVVVSVPGPRSCHPAGEEAHKKAATAPVKESVWRGSQLDLQSWAVGRMTILPTSTSAGCSIE